MVKIQGTAHIAYIGYTYKQYPDVAWMRLYGGKSKAYFVCHINVLFN